MSYLYISSLKALARQLASGMPQMPKSHDQLSCKTFLWGMMLIFKPMQDLCQSDTYTKNTVIRWKVLKLLSGQQWRTNGGQTDGQMDRWTDAFGEFDLSCHEHGWTQWIQYTPPQLHCRGYKYQNVWGILTKWNVKCFICVDRNLIRNKRKGDSYDALSSKLFINSLRTSDTYMRR